MKDTEKKFKDTLEIIDVNIQKKKPPLPEINIEEAEMRLAIVAEQIYHYNQKSGGKMTYAPLSNGTLLIVASLPGHELGIAKIDSGIVPAIDGKAVE